MNDTLEETLAHHGVLGMHWGHRKPQTQAEITAQRSKLDGNKIIAGEGLLGYQLQKQNKVLAKRQGKTYGDLTPEQQQVYTRQAGAAIKTRIIGQNAFEAIGVAGLSLAAAKVFHASPATTQAAISIGVLVGATALATSVSQVRAVNQAEKSRELDYQSKQLRNS